MYLGEYARTDLCAFCGKEIDHMRDSICEHGGDVPADMAHLECCPICSANAACADRHKCDCPKCRKGQTCCIDARWPSSPHGSHAEPAYHYDCGKCWPKGAPPEALRFWSGCD